MSAFEDLQKSLLEAIDIEKGNIPMAEKKNMPAPTFVAIEREREIIDAICNIRKEKKVSQKELAQLTGNKQQAISRLEKKGHSPSLKLALSLLHALGYDLQLVKL